jgi:hypothetical protein
VVLSSLLLEGQLNIFDRMNVKKQAGNAPNAQNKSIGDYGSEGLGFESLRARFTLVFDSISNFIECVTH